MMHEPMNIADNLQLPLAGAVGQRFAIFGTSGKGKSHTMKVLCEEFIRNGIPMTIIDRDGEYWPMAALGRFIRIGRDEYSEMDCPIEGLGNLAIYSIEHGVSIILNLNHLKRNEYRPYVETYLNALWEAITARKDKTPYFLIVEEAHEFAPQKGASETKELLIEMSKRGRKFGLGMVVVTQRAASISKDVISQASIRIFHQAAYATDIEVYKDNVPKLAMPPSEVERVNATLKRGQAIIVLHNEQALVSQIRPTNIVDTGATPGLEGVALADMNPIDPKEIAGLREFLSAYAQPDKSAAVPNDGLQSQVTELENALRQKSEQLRDAQAKIRALEAKPQVDKSQPTIKAAPPTKEAIRTNLVGFAAQREQKAFTALLKSVRGISSVWKSAFAYLLINDGRRYSIRQLSRHLGYGVDSLYKNQPIFLLENGLVCREGKSEQTMCWAQADKELAERFPNLNTEDCMHQLLSNLER